jgi:hypothetical protein
VVADDRGKGLFIQVTRMANSPLAWHVAVNNPTDKEITTTIRTAMEIPGLVLPERQWTIPPGEYVVLLDQVPR